MIVVLQKKINGFICIGAGLAETGDVQRHIFRSIHYQHRPFSDKQTSRMAQAAAASMTGMARWTMHGS